MSKLLINESPLQVLPTLAREIGLNEAIALQQIHYLVQAGNMGRTIDGRRWIYNSVREWQENHFPFWSEDTVKRTLDNLRDLGLVETANHNQNKFDKTLWYAVDYAALGKVQESIDAKCPNRETQDAEQDEGELLEPIPKDLPKELPKEKQQRARGTVEFPPELDSPEFAQAWFDWLAHRRERGADDYSKPAARALLGRWAQHGQVRTITAIRYSMERNWLSIHEPEQGEYVPLGNGNKPRKLKPGEKLTAGGETFIVGDDGKPQRIESNA